MNTHRDSRTRHYHDSHEYILQQYHTTGVLSSVQEYGRKCMGTLPRSYSIELSTLCTNSLQIPSPSASISMKFQTYEDS
ncbi:uncharacterized protein RSE6_03006 [Rhynchosporium secalis]|uniref:Uncharacterized protein n=1 Tax=Rhynchosporium secalis TaxID=38038 RepID=A0A1E1M1N7_RHYSE|nr:uncharacterized protein RSE6_03006 [Rhynchosporium secalis]